MKSLTPTLKAIATKHLDFELSEYGRGTFDTNTIAMSIAYAYDQEIEYIKKLYHTIYEEVCDDFKRDRDLNRK